MATSDASVEPAQWHEAFDALMSRIASRFPRVEPRLRVRRFITGLLSDLPRKNCWTLAEHAGEATPHGMQHLLSRAKWDADLIRDDIRAYVVEHLHEADAVLVVDETGDLKKGTTTVGVQRQYTGTAGRIENAQVAVYLVYSATRGHAAIDRTCRAHGQRMRTAAGARRQVAAGREDQDLRPEYWGANRASVLLS